jgi:hypothetical protein
MNQMPLAFTKNMGQWDERVLFRTTAGGATMWFTKEGVTYQFTRRIDTRNGTVPAPGVVVGQDRFGPDNSGFAGAPPLAVGSDPFDRLGNTRGSIEQLVLTAKFVGANPNPEVVGENMMEYKCNYFLGNEPSKWRTDVPNYEAITLKNIYPGIDLRYSGRRGAGQAAYEFIAAPGADIAQIKVEYEGAEATSIDADGRLILQTKWGDMVAAIKSPANGVLYGTSSFSQLSEKTIGFEPAGASRQALGTLSVGLVYSTYLGGSSDDRGEDIAVDGNGNAYVTGITTSSNFPVQNPYQTYQGNYDIFVTKLSSSGSSLIYSTYLGGGGDDHYGNGIAVDDSGNAYVTGSTTSSDFPTVNPYQATLQGGEDAFVTKLSISGNSLIYSTYLGGGGEESGEGIAVDVSGKAYVTGFTSSADFPTLNPYQSYQGGSDVFVTKLSSTGNSLIYSTYLGGAGNDEGKDIAIDGSGNAYVAGGTWSFNFPTLNPYQTDQGDQDAFVTKLSSSGNSLIYSTYLGGGSLDAAEDIAVDGSGCAYVTGLTTSSNFATENPYKTYQGGYDAFVTKLSSSGNSLIYSTYLGGGGYDWGIGVVVDGSGNACVTGYTFSSDFPTLNPYQMTFQGGEYDAFVTKLSNSGNSLIYSTYLGGVGGEYGQRIAIDGSGNAFVTGYTSSTNFPALNSYQGTYGGGIYDAFVAKLHFDASPCIGSQVLFCDDFDNGLNFLWTTEGSCTWEVTGGEARASLTGYEIGCFLIVRDTTWTDYTFEYDVRGNAGVDKGVAFRFKGQLGYSFSIRSDWSGDEAYFGFPGHPYAQNVQFPSQNGIWYHVQITCQGNHIVIKVDGATIIDYVDVTNSCPSGGIRLDCWTGMPGVCDVSFDNVVVKSTNTAPTTFALSSPDSGLTTPVTTPLPQFTWVSSSDPDPLDSVRYTLFIATDQHFNFTKQIPDLTTTSFTLTDSLTWGTRYWWKVKAADRNGGTTWSNQVFTFRTVTPGDADNNGVVSLSDVVYIVNYIFAGGPAPQPLPSGDADCSGRINLADAVYLINYIFAAGPPPCGRF